MSGATGRNAKRDPIEEGPPTVRNTDILSGLQTPGARLPSQPRGETSGGLRSLRASPLHCPGPERLQRHRRDAGRRFSPHWSAPSLGRSPAGRDRLGRASLLMGGQAHPTELSSSRHTPVREFPTHLLDEAKSCSFVRPERPSPVAGPKNGDRADRVSGFGAGGGVRWRA